MVRIQYFSMMLCLAMLALASCSSSSGQGSRPPSDVTVVSPPSGSSTTVYP